MIGLKTGLASAAFVFGAVLALHGEPTHADRLAQHQIAQEAILQKQSIFLDPAEVNSLMHDKMSQVQLMDLRSETDFNQFHLLDSWHWDPAECQRPDIASRLNPDALKILISNDASLALAAWRDLHAEGVRDVYVMEGGINLWLDLFKDGQTHAKAVQSDERLRHHFDAALGARYPFSRPIETAQSERRYTERAKKLSKAKVVVGGCG